MDTINVNETNANDMRPVSPWRMAETLIEVMQVVATPSRYLRLGKALIQQGVRPEDLRAWYGTDGRWFREDWRGQRGQRPTEFGIRETARRFLDAPEEATGRRSNIASAVEAAIQRMNAHGQ